MKKSIVFKIFLNFVVVLVMLSTGILYLSFDSIREHYLDKSAADLEKMAIIFNAKIQPLWAANDFGDFDKTTKALGKDIDARITIIRKDGVVLADSEKDPLKMENHSSRIELVKALKDKTGISQRHSSTVQDDMLYVAVPTKVNGEIVGFIRVSMYISDLVTLLNYLKMDILQITLLMIAISLGLAYFFTRGIIKPLRQLVEISKKVAEGNFDVKILMKNNDELKVLADSFNDMTEKMKLLFEELSNQKNELDTIISSIQEGLLVLDDKGIVQMNNESLKRLFNVSFEQNKPYWNFLRDPQLDKLFRTIIESKKNVIEEVEIENKVILCSSTYIDSNSTIIFLFFDITEIRWLERIRKDFVSNVSHELKTPLTAIKGFTETIAEEEDLKNRQHIEIVKRHTDRMINIVEDLLTLSSLESDRTLVVETIDLKSLINQVVKIFESRLNEKKLSLKINIADSVKPINADRFKLEQLFINLLDNAVKYTEKGEICVDMKQKINDCSIEIKDTGIGIPREDLNRIFERFYVVDKSRSRKLGGTGLGLSIVKHIVKLHNGEINVDSIFGKGTTFTIILPEKA